MKKETPLLFKPHLVRAIYAGQKTHTLRPMKHQPNIPATAHPIARAELLRDWLREHPSPYGGPGDLCWCRETWTTLVCEEEYAKAGEPIPVLYRSDDDWYDLGKEEQKDLGIVWRPSIHMPKWASNLWLENVQVTPIQLSEMTAELAYRDGITLYRGKTLVLPGDNSAVDIVYISLARAQWDAIYGKKYPSKNDPWVWDIEFRIYEGKE